MSRAKERQKQQQQKLKRKPLQPTPGYTDTAKGSIRGTLQTNSRLRKAINAGTQTNHHATTSSANRTRHPPSTFPSSSYYRPHPSSSSSSPLLSLAAETISGLDCPLRQSNVNRVPASPFSSSRSSSASSERPASQPPSFSSLPASSSHSNRPAISAFDEIMYELLAEKILHTQADSTANTPYEQQNRTEELQSRSALFSREDQRAEEWALSPPPTSQPQQAISTQYPFALDEKSSSSLHSVSIDKDRHNNESLTPSVAELSDIFSQLQSTFGFAALTATFSRSPSSSSDMHNPSMVSNVRLILFRQARQHLKRLQHDYNLIYHSNRITHKNIYELANQYTQKRQECIQQLLTSLQREEEASDRILKEAVMERWVQWLDHSKRRKATATSMDLLRTNRLLRECWTEWRHRFSIQMTGRLLESKKRYSRMGAIFFLWREETRVVSLISRMQERQCRRLVRSYWEDWRNQFRRIHSLSSLSLAFHLRFHYSHFSSLFKYWKSQTLIKQRHKEEKLLLQQYLLEKQLYPLFIIWRNASHQLRLTRSTMMRVMNQSGKIPPLLYHPSSRKFWLLSASSSLFPPSLSTAPGVTDSILPSFPLLRKVEEDNENHNSLFSAEEEEIESEASEGEDQKGE